MSGFCYIPGGSLILNPWLHSQKLDTFDPPKGLAPIQTGDPPKMASEWPLGFSKEGKGLRISLRSVTSLSPVPLCSLHQIS